MGNTGTIMTNPQLDIIYPSRANAKRMSQLNRHFTRQLGSKRYQNMKLAEAKAEAANKKAIANA